MKNLLIVFCLVLSLMLMGMLYGCTQTTSSSSSGDGDSSYYPHVNGYSWTYNTSSKTTTKTIYNSNTYLSTQETSGTEVDLFNGTSEVSGVGTAQVLQVTTTTTSGSTTSNSLIVANSSNVKYYGTTSAPTTDALTMLVFPLSVGSSWTTQNGGITVEASVIAKESVTVPAGTFSDCYKVKYSSNYIINSANMTYDVYAWFAKNVGGVKNVSVLTATFSYSGMDIETTSLSTIELTAKSF